MPQFSTHESVSLEKEIDSRIKPVQTKPEDIDDIYEINRCAEWIKSNGFLKVCLQFPDYLLPDSSDVALKLQSILGQTIYILGDTAYGSCCIDYVAAAHVEADAIIHFGPICFSKTSANVSYLNIYEKHNMNTRDLETCYCELFQDRKDKIFVLVDSPYIHRLDDILNCFEKYENVTVLRIDEEKLEIRNHTTLFIGINDRKLINIELALQPKALYNFNANSEPPKISRFEQESRVLKRRNYLIEKVKDSRTMGIVIGTLAVRNYLDVIQRIKKLAEASGKKYYLISVGKPTVAKLANFPEIDVYVMIMCSMNEIYESRDFYKPIVTPFDVEIALNTSRDKNIKFSYDYNSFLNNPSSDLKNLKLDKNQEPDVSLLTGRIRLNEPEEMIAPSSSGTQVALKSEGAVALSSNYGAGFLADRSWKGLEQNLGQTEAKLAEEGRSGKATGYKNEKY